MSVTLEQLLEERTATLQQLQENWQEAHQWQALERHITRQIGASVDLDRLLPEVLTALRSRLQIDSCHFAWYRPHADVPGWEVIQEAKLPQAPSWLGWYPAAVGELLTEILPNQALLRVDNVEA
ncbi:MAG TPA: hypothetical protein V6D04_07410, partial [Candidatus Obscuribacterales bacterium]